MIFKFTAKGKLTGIQSFLPVTLRPNSSAGRIYFPLTLETGKGSCNTYVQVLPKASGPVSSSTGTLMFEGKNDLTQAAKSLAVLPLAPYLAAVHHGSLQTVTVGYCVAQIACTDRQNVLYYHVTPCGRKALTIVLASRMMEHTLTGKQFYVQTPRRGVIRRCRYAAVITASPQNS
jgi:hypothetical protein